MSPASASYRENLDSPTIPDPSIPSELPITPELKSAFLASLGAHKISIRFFSGSWDTFDISNTGGKYDIVLTSETIYQTESLPSLIKLMKSVCGCSDRSLEALASSQLSLASKADTSYLCLVAAKVLYFGVGGGVSEFLNAVKDHGAAEGGVETVWEHKLGVGRKIMRVRWAT